jgi:His/Glu/Gln/Arg/opine family amino acid ABC transporter permease subunit
MTLIDYCIAISRGIWTTFALSIISFVLGGILALPITIARVSDNSFARGTAKAFIALVRGVPPITWLFLVFYGLGQLGLSLPSLVAAILGLSLICSAYMAEVYRSGWLALSPGQLEASKAIGLSSITTLRSVVTPQVFVTILPMAITYFIGHLKETALVSVIGVHDITELALSLSRAEPRPFDVFIAAGIVYLAISVPIGVLGRGLAPWVAKRFGMA